MKKKIFVAILIFTMTVTSFTAIAEKIDSENKENTITEENTEENKDEVTEENTETDNAETEEESKFSDVENDAWYFDSVNFVTERGIMSGTSDTEFSPNDSATRGMIALIMKNIENDPRKVYWSYFDVKEDAWYADAVAWCSETGIMKGYGEGLFGPDDYVTREQLVSILYNYAKYKNYGNMETNGIELLAYKDYADVSGYAGGPMQWALKNQIISGKDGNKLDPKGIASRAEIAQIIRNFMVFYNL